MLIRTFPSILDAEVVGVGQAAELVAELNQSVQTTAHAVGARHASTAVLE